MECIAFYVFHTRLLILLIFLLQKTRATNANSDLIDVEEDELVTRFLSGKKRNGRNLWRGSSFRYSRHDLACSCRRILFVIQREAIRRNREEKRLPLGSHTNKNIQNSVFSMNAREIYNTFQLVFSILFVASFLLARFAKFPSFRC